MGDTEVEQIYPLKRDSVEAKRLNHQHDLTRTYFSEELIYPSLAKESLESVADIATGTGIWLDEVSQDLENVPTKSGNQRSYDGFDISSGMFPPNPQKGMSFHVQDMFQPFAAEFHGKYDLVHVRYVVAATKGDTYKIIVKNIIPLLKPGGYIQWDDIYWPPAYFNPNPTANATDREQAIAELKTTDEVITSWERKYDTSSVLPDLIQAYLEETGLEAVTKHEYPAPDTEERIAAAREFRIETTEAMQAMVLLMGKNAEEAAATVGKYLDILRKYFAEGWVSTIPVATVLARRGQ